MTLLNCSEQVGDAVGFTVVGSLGSVAEGSIVPDA